MRITKTRVIGFLASMGVIAYLAWVNLWFPMTNNRIQGKYLCDSGYCGAALDVRADGTFVEYDGSNILATGRWRLETGLEPTLNLNGAYPLEDSSYSWLERRRRGLLSPCDKTLEDLHSDQPRSG